MISAFIFSDILYFLPQKESKSMKQKRKEMTSGDGCFWVEIEFLQLFRNFDFAARHGNYDVDVFLLRYATKKVQ